jgi:NitT/TauT family transport system substrate-binding protein
LSLPLLRLFSALCLALLSALPARAADKLRLGVQASGTFGWELAVARSRGLDKQADLDLETVELATTDAGKIALAGGAADLILSDWLWAARERSLGNDMLFYPHSTASGAVMAKDAAAFKKPADFVGKKLGVAGGPLDKSWLMLQAWALRQGVDLKARADIAYAAPPLLAEKLGQGELDAVLEFWPFAARLQARGFARVVDMAEVERDLGAKGPVIVTGYVFRDRFAAKNGPALARFFDMMAKAKNLIANDDSAFAEIAPKVAAIAGGSDPATLAIFRQYYRQGVPTRPLAADIADATAIFSVLAKVGGPQLVGSAKELDTSVFYSPVEGARKP